ncbi:hypothetical protein [Lactobacillus sp. Sy-1]|uniref:hypothetical protein n=1 Tax=Lactobacillus sp. Sy-1 TaxID=2109645 RepID=UPI001C5AEE85|nr:hypothetical protein [Lactobacillus sp. Sy-1]MBW1605862.1 hypothetical protein [Lactobacillus sp. Sy-1]
MNPIRKQFFKKSKKITFAIIAISSIYTTTAWSFEHPVISSANTIDINNNGYGNVANSAASAADSYNSKIHGLSDFPYMLSGDLSDAMKFNEEAQSAAERANNPGASDSEKYSAAYTALFKLKILENLYNRDSQTIQNLNEAGGIDANRFYLERGGIYSFIPHSAVEVYSDGRKAEEVEITNQLDQIKNKLQSESKVNSQSSSVENNSSTNHSEFNYQPRSAVSSYSEYDDFDYQSSSAPASYVYQNTSNEWTSHSNPATSLQNHSNPDNFMNNQYQLNNNFMNTTNQPNPNDSTNNQNQTNVTNPAPSNNEAQSDNHSLTPQPSNSATQHSSTSQVNSKASVDTHSSGNRKQIIKDVNKSKAKQQTKAKQQAKSKQNAINSQIKKFQGQLNKLKQQLKKAKGKQQSKKINAQLIKITQKIQNLIKQR